MKRTPFVIAAILLLLVGAVAIGWIYYQDNPDEWDSFLEEMGGQPSSSTAPKAEKRSARNQDELEASGSIEANEFLLSTLTGGRIVDVLVEEGQAIAAGDLLLRIDDAHLQARRDALLAIVDQAAAVLTAAQAQLAMAIASPRLEEIAAAEGAVQTASAQVDLASAGLEGVEAAIDSGEGPVIPSDQDLAAAEAQVEMARGQLAQAQAQLVLVSSGATVHDLEILEAQVDQAEAGLAAAQAAIRSIDIEIENASISSPIDGVVLQRLSNPGEIAAPAAALFLVADLDELTLTVFVPEAELGKVMLGQRALVSVDANEDAFDGIVTHISSAAEFTPRNVQTQEERVHMVFAVKILLDNSEGLLRPGMPADATFAESME